MEDTAVDARFDPALDAWVLRRHAEVVAALDDGGLSGGGDIGAGGAHVTVRDAARHAFSSDRMAKWRARIDTSASEVAGSLSRLCGSVDLMREFAAPWSLTLAGMIAGAPTEELPRLAGLARRVFLAAARATDSEISDDARSAATELARGFSAMGEAAPIGVQAFVALSQTLPCFLGAAWSALLRHPRELARLRADREMMPGAVEELLRYAGPSHAVFRRALVDVRIDDSDIREGDRVILLLAAANRDPERFGEPDRLDLGRDATGHLAFGRGTHFCAGASMIRVATATATTALLETLTTRELAAVTWINGFAIRGVESLVVRPAAR